MFGIAVFRSKVGRTRALLSSLCLVVAMVAATLVAVPANAVAERHEPPAARSTAVDPSALSPVATPSQAAEPKLCAQAEFNGPVLSGRRGRGRNESKPRDVDLPPGEYRIVLESKDSSHAGRGRRSEANEQWLLEGFDELGDLYLETAPSDDLPDRERENRTDVGVYRVSNVTSVRARHAFVGDDKNSIRPMRAMFYALEDICPGEVIVEGLDEQGTVIWSYDTSSGTPRLDDFADLSLEALAAMRVVEQGVVLGSYELPYDGIVDGELDMAELVVSAETSASASNRAAPSALAPIESCDRVVRPLRLSPGEVVTGYDGFSLINPNDDISLEDRYLELSLGGNPNTPGLTFSFVESREGRPDQSTRFDLAPNARIPLAVRVSAQREGSTLLVAEQREDNRFRGDPLDAVYCAEVTVIDDTTTTTTTTTTTRPTTTSGPTTTGGSTTTGGPTTTGGTTTSGPTTTSGSSTTNGPTTTGGTTTTGGPTTTSGPTTTVGPPTTPAPREPGDIEDAVEFVEDALVDEVPEGVPELENALNEDDSLADKQVADLSSALAIPAIAGLPAIAVGPAVETAVVGTGATVTGVAVAKAVAVATVVVVVIGSIAWAYSAVDARLEERATVDRIETGIQRWVNNQRIEVPNRELFTRAVIERLARLCWDRTAAGSIPDSFGRNPCEGLPIYFPSETDLGEVAILRVDAITLRPDWVRQYRRVKRHPSGWLRGPIVGGVSQGVPGCLLVNGANPPGQQCDEFPNAIFLDGGRANDPLVRFVDGALNGLEGRKLGAPPNINPNAFFQECKIERNPVENSRKDPFLVIPLPNVEIAGQGIDFPPTFNFCPGRLDE